MTRAAAIGVGLLFPAMALADIIPPCPTPANAHSVSLPSGLPIEIAADISTQVRATVIAAPGEAFDATDALVTGVRARYIFAWKTGANWIVALEHGGRGYNDPVLRYEPRPDGPGFRLARMQVAGPQNVCEISTAMAKL